MAFIASGDADNNQYFFMDRYIGGDGHMKEWVYVTTDTRDTTLTAGYFSAWRGAPPRPGDLLRIYTVSDLTNLATATSVCVVSIGVWNVSYIDLSNAQYAQLAGADFTGPVNVDNDFRVTGGWYIYVDAVDSGFPAYVIVSAGADEESKTVFWKGGNARWDVGNTTGAEGGANAGSDFEFVPYDDAEAALPRALLIKRSTGAVTFTVAPTITTVAAHADDAAAASGGIPVGGLYRTASALKIRVA